MKKLAASFVIAAVAVAATLAPAHANTARNITTFKGTVSQSQPAQGNKCSFRWHSVCNGWCWVGC